MRLFEDYASLLSVAADRRLAAADLAKSPDVE
jgi:hypothetical protein